MNKKNEFQYGNPLLLDSTSSLEYVKKLQKIKNSAEYTRYLKIYNLYRREKRQEISEENEPNISIPKNLNYVRNEMLRVEVANSIIIGILKEYLFHFFNKINYDKLSIESIKANLISLTTVIQDRIKVYSKFKYRLVLSNTIGELISNHSIQIATATSTEWNVDKDVCLSVKHVQNNYFIILLLFAVFSDEEEEEAEKT